MDVIITAFGSVKLSQRSLAWLDSIHIDWRTFAPDKKQRGKRAEYARQKVKRFAEAVAIAAEIAWHAGDDLKEF